MATLNFTPHEHGVRRVVLIDFDWMDADLIPELLRHPGLSVRLVAGACADDPGMRVAELCGVPRTLELGDLTREMFDVALVGEQSARRGHVANLFQALGTPVVSPQAFLGGVRGFERRRSSRVSPRAEAMSVLVGDEVAALIDHAIPNLGAPAADPALAAAPPAWSAQAHPMPPPGDRLGLERLLAQLAHQTDAFASALLVRRGDGFALAATNGADDPLLRALGELALKVDATQVVCRMNGTRTGKVWGAWPFRTREHRGALLAAGLNPEHGAEVWERAAFALRYAWDRAGGDLAGSPEDRYRNTWLTPAEFRSRLRLAVERHQRDGRRFAIHRLHVDGAPGTVEVLCQRMPEHLRATDCLCRPAAGVILLLVGGAASDYSSVRDRINALWAQCWLDVGVAAAPPIGDERIELAARDDAEVFVAAATGWLAAG
jgi:hypothetical protein